MEKRLTIFLEICYTKHLRERKGNTSLVAAEYPQLWKLGCNSINRAERNHSILTRQREPPRNAQEAPTIVSCDNGDKFHLVDREEQNITYAAPLIWGPGKLVYTHGTKMGLLSFPPITTVGKLSLVYTRALYMSCQKLKIFWFFFFFWFK